MIWKAGAFLLTATKAEPFAERWVRDFIRYGEHGKSTKK